MVPSYCCLFINKECDVIGIMGGVFWLITGKVVFYTVNDEMNEFLIGFALVTELLDFFE